MIAGECGDFWTKSTNFAEEKKFWPWAIFFWAGGWLRGKTLAKIAEGAASTEVAIVAGKWRGGGILLGRQGDSVIFDGEEVAGEREF